MPHASETPQPVRIEDYRPSDYLIDRVDLDVRLAPQQTRVGARLAIRSNQKASASEAPLVLDGEQIELRALAVDGAPLAPAQYRLTATRLTIPRVPQRPFLLDIETACDPDANTALTGLYRSNGIYCTQCEAEGFRRIGYYLDRPDVLARFTTRIEARRAEAAVLLANGNLIAAGAIEDTDRHFAVWQDPFPKPSYLFAMVGGNLACVADTFTTASGRTVELRIYVEPGKEDRCGWALESLKRAMRWDEQAFGREYDLDVFMVVAVPDFNMGAMENKGLNIFNDKYVLARPDTATDQDYANIEGVIAHEYFHNWTGNRITCRDWFQLCLKEGLTVYRDQEFSADMRSRPVKRIADVKLLRSQQFPEDAGPLAHPVRPGSYLEINNFYTATVYEKGAELVRMLRTLLGATAFRRAMDLYFERHDGEAATVEDFVQCMADASGRDLGQFLRWYAQAGTPEVSASGRFFPAERVYELKVAQATPPTPGEPNKEALLIPLAIGLIGPDGAELPLELEGVGALDHSVVELAAPVEKFRFRNIAARPVASLNRGFAAPIKLTANLSEDDLLFLMAHDGDPFNRWEAGQTTARRLLLSLSEDARRGRRLGGGAALAKALATCLEDGAIEPAFAAQMLSLPSEGDLAAEIGREVDPEAIHRARGFLRMRLGRLLADDFTRLYRQHAPSGAYTPDAESSGRRALRNTALDYLAHADRSQGPQRALAHFETAANMTDAIAALTTLSQIDCAEREQALDAFYRRHRGDPLLVDKWLALNAMTPFPGAAERVRGLMDHEAFVFTTPNKVRSLIGTFAALNPVAFHEASGTGYRLLADVVLKLDPINPQVAARLAANFKSWRALESRRRTRAQAEIERIAAAASLSRDSREIVSRMLA